MIRGILVFISVLFLAVPADAKSWKKVFEGVLRESAQKGVMFGHHDDTMYGYTWRYDNSDRSDTKDVVGLYPAMMSFDLSDIDKGTRNRTEYERMRVEIRKQHARGGFVTISWHATNLLTGKNAWDVSTQNTIRSVLPNGAKAQAFLSCLDNLADFFKSLKDAEGQPIPVIFRPWHECNGTWFWWGSNQCTSKEYKALWKLMVKHLAKKGVGNVIYAYSPGDNIRTDEDFLERYPGDKIISVFGVEGYAIRTTGSDADRKSFIARIRRSFDVVAPLALQRNKILAFTETGTKFNSDTQWWTKALLPAIEGYPVCFLVTWRNATKDDNECFGVYPGHPSEADFKRFAADSRIIFRK